MRTTALAVLGVMLALASLAAKTVSPRDRAPTSWDITIAPTNEPGPRLVLSGRVVTSDSRKPVPGVTVYAYHADASGRYHKDANARTEARLAGVLRTNERGEYRIRTVMPGGSDPHLHVEVWAPNVPKVATEVDLHRAMASSDTPVLPKKLHEYRPRQDATDRRRPANRDKDGGYAVTWDIAVRVVDPRKYPKVPVPGAR